ncbi:winged helix-turn-helix domain-containing protein [Aliikangiella sp. IMCC44359]|uniref:winged helix-turn-helix domain-containing protein n=1 Tax=Aliikangiella sp. IMCC44359 TaxID=3459125 RepID=UPI00403AD9DD
MYNSNIDEVNELKVSIGSVLYDASSQCLSKGADTIYLRNKLNEVLFHMVVNKHRVVSREELIQKVWNGNYYTGVKGLTHSVCKLRKTLTDLGANEVKIQTYPKQGYLLSYS